MYDMYKTCRILMTIGCKVHSNISDFYFLTTNSIIRQSCETVLNYDNCHGYKDQRTRSTKVHKNSPQESILHYIDNLARYKTRQYLRIVSKLVFVKLKSSSSPVLFRLQHRDLVEVSTSLLEEYKRY